MKVKFPEPNKVEFIDEGKFDNKSLFTLTPEEVVIVNHFLTCDKNKLEKEEKSFENDLMINDLDHILNKIKQWQDEILSRNNV